MCCCTARTSTHTSKDQPHERLDYPRHAAPSTTTIPASTDNRRVADIDAIADDRWTCTAVIAGESIIRHSAHKADVAAYSTAREPTTLASLGALRADHGTRYFSSASSASASSLTSSSRARRATLKNDGDGIALRSILRIVSIETPLACASSVCGFLRSCRALCKAAARRLPSARCSAVNARRAI